MSQTSESMIISDESHVVSSDDHATLDAALAFVDEYDGWDFDPAIDLHNDNTVTLLGSSICATDNTSVQNEEPQSSLVPETTPSIVATTAVSTKRSTNRSRTRQKDELVYLRGVVEKLEEELSTLKKRSIDADDTTSDPPEPLAFVWEELAARQYAQRQRAEVENVKLRTMLEEQIRVAKNLERLLKKRTMAEFLVPTSVKRIRKMKDTSVVDDPYLFDELLATIAEMYTKVDHVFGDERFVCKTTALREIQARNDEELGTIVEVYDSRIGPFELEKVSNAVWHHMAKQSLDPNAFHDQVVELTDSTLKREFGSTVDMPRFKGTFRGKITARRIVEDERILVLWAALLDPEKISDTPMDGLLMRQRGWILMRRPPPAFVRSDRPATLTQSYHMTIPDLDEDQEGEHRHKVGTLTNFVLSSVDFHLEMGRQMIENLLFEEGWKTPMSNTSSPDATVASMTSHSDVY